MLKEKQGVRGEWEWVIEQTGRKTAIENCFSCCKVGPFLEFDSLAFTVSQSSHQRVFFFGGGIILINLSVSPSHTFPRPILFLFTVMASLVQLFTDTPHLENV